MLSFASFEQSVQQQNVTLDPSLLMAGRAYDSIVRSGVYYDWPPNAISGTLQSAAVNLRTSPNRPLASSAEPIALDKLPAGRMVQALGAMVNASMLPPPERSYPNDISFSGADKTIDNCTQAEIGFLKAYRTIRGRSKLLDMQVYSPRVDNRVRLIVDSENKPVLVQKSAGDVWSALTVREIYINGIPHPAGSIVRVSYLDPQNKNRPPNGLTILPASAIGSVAFQRLSTFAIDPGERPKKRWDYGWTFLDRRGLRELTIEKIAQAATKRAQAVKRKPKINS